jgi:hypothetical protein
MQTFASLWCKMVIRWAFLYIAAQINTSSNKECDLVYGIEEMIWMLQLNTCHMDFFARDLGHVTY